MAYRLPPYSWDSHIHVIDPENFPLSPDRTYTPLPAPISAAQEYCEEQSISHPVIVTPSVYGTDNRILLAALEAFSPNAIGVAVLDPYSDPPPSPEDLQSLHDAGVRGLRINFAGNPSPAVLHAHAELCKPHNWVLQLYIPLGAFATLHTLIPTLGVRVVADHFAGAVAGENPYAQRGFAEVVDLMKRGELWVKISAPYLGSRVGWEGNYADMGIVAKELLEQAPQMCVYGSDWPHVQGARGGDPLTIRPFRDADDSAFVDVVKAWVGHWRAFQQIMVDNPRRLWGWEGRD
ncbi:amidohydrolase 2 [Choiromyces venosus 120613-1]|uniref:Amidohydrolase 2 n=1 Tax=Choiromyces venosus 120613-1 TaxID=1336337 RepID=A0A3N4J627_9PEZI|nr:amidohydrolase 2 [Choiromyces venosus 120613-1]